MPRACHLDLHYQLNIASSCFMQQCIHITIDQPNCILNNKGTAKNMARAARRIICFIPLGLLAIFSFATAAHAAPETLDSRAQSVFAATKDAVVQIRVLLKGSQSQKGLGSGFYVSDDGLIITNYHVVSDNALEPQTYALEYLGKNGERGPLTLLAVDVLHDLALVQRKGGHAPWLKFNVVPTGKGEILYSLGNPNDLGLSITEGVNNGLRDHSFYEAIHFTGPINPGMSGGPVVNLAGRLVGVNDATMGESRGFLVPSHFAQALIQRWHAKPKIPATFTPEITRQLKEHSAAIVARLTNKPLPIQPGEKYTVPDAADDFISCWGNEQNEAKYFYKVKNYVCFGDARVYVGDGITTGRVMYLTKLFQSSTLDAMRFGRVLEKDNLPADSMDDNTKRKHYSKYSCEESIVNLSSLKVKAVVCMRAYKKFPGLYDFRFKAITLRPPNKKDTEKNAVIYRLLLTGVTHDDGLRMLSHYMEAIKWND
jgi:serine protease Do